MSTTPTNAELAARLEQHADYLNMRGKLIMSDELNLAAKRLRAADKLHECVKKIANDFTGGEPNSACAARYALTTYELEQDQ